MLSGKKNGAITGVGISMGGLEVHTGTGEDAETVLPWRCIRMMDDEENDHGNYECIYWYVYHIIIITIIMKFHGNLQKSYRQSKHIHHFPKVKLPLTSRALHCSIQVHSRKAQGYPWMLHL